MPDVQSEAQAAARRQLERVLASPGFARNERLSRFLRYVVERHLEGRDQELKEALIAIEILGRRPDYDPKLDPIVRTEASRLRARLGEYYLGEGKTDPLVIELPKGGYIPRFRQAEATRDGHGAGPRRLWLAIGLAGLAVALATIGWSWWQHQAAPIAIAVLPLTNLSQDPTNDYFADGLTGEIIRNLSIIDGLVVRSQTSSFVFKGKPQNVREAGKQLAAEYILEGSVLRAGRQLRINAQFVRARDDFPVWSGRYDREITDVFAIQDEISNGIVNGLRLKLGRGRRRYETSTEAYDLYLRARASSPQEQSIRRFEEATAKDPSFAPAYAGLAGAHALLSGYGRADRAEEMSKMRAAAEKAIQLDPLLAEAHYALGMVYSREAQWEQSEKSFRRSLELDPGSSLGRTNFAMFLLLPLGRIEEAVTQVRVAEKADPLSHTVQLIAAYVLTSAGRFDEAAACCERLPADDPQKPGCLGRALLGQGKIPQAVRALEARFSGRLPDEAGAGELGYAYARAGRREEAERIAAAVPRAIDQALVFAGLGDKDRALEALDRMVPLGPFRVGRALTWPEFAMLRGDPRVRALRKKVGLPE